MSINTHFGTDLDDEVSYNNIKQNKGKTTLFSEKTETEKRMREESREFSKMRF